MSLLSRPRGLLALCLVIGGAAAVTPGPAAAQAAENPIYLDTTRSFEQRAADLVSRMTLPEKIRQLITNDAPAIPRLGVQEYTYWSEALHGIASLGNSKQPGDDTSGAVKATGFPTNLATSMSWNPELQRQIGDAISSEARGFLDKSLFGVARNNIGPSKDNYGSLTYFAPTVNLDRNPLWGRADEGYGEDPYLVSQMASGFINGFQGQNADGYLKAAATLKHYALNNVENGRTGISSDVSDTELRDYYTKQFAAIIGQAHTAGLMTAYNAVNGTPAVANTYTTNHLARRTYGFDGYTTSDCGGVTTTYQLPPSGHDWAPPGWATNSSSTKPTWINDTTGAQVSARAGGQAMALRSGNDLNCSGEEMTAANVEAAVGAGLLDEGVLDTSLVRVFTVRMRTGEFDPAGSVPYTSITKAEIQSADHVALATRAADESMVLLKNSGSVLPVQASSVKKAVVLGALADTVNLGSYGNGPDKQISMRQGIVDALPGASVTFDAGTGTLSAATQTAVKAADLVVVVAGTDHDTAGEGNDRKTLALPGTQGALIDQVAALGNPHTVLDIQSVGPVTIGDRLAKIPAVLFSAYNGQSQGTALADVLFGKQNPQGHLTFTWYADDSQLAAPGDYNLTSGLGQTYQHFTGKPTFPFGYGLSYATFSYSAAQVDKTAITADGTVNVSFEVKNTGTVAGATVAQLYSATPYPRLVGFKNTGVLQPGQSLKITLPVRAADLSVWNPATARQTVTPGSYVFRVGSDSATALSSATVAISGTLAPKAQTVTIDPGKVVLKAGETLDLRGKNPWIKDDTDPAKEKRDVSITADDVVEAVNNDQSFIDLSKTTVTYASSDTKVATVSSAGVVTAVSDGVVTISATVGGVTGSAVLVVRDSLAVKADPLLRAGQAGTVTTTLTHNSSTPLTNVSVSLPVPSGWTAQATGPTTFATVAAGSPAVTTWHVTPPAGSPGTFAVTATATYDGGQHIAGALLAVPYDSAKAAYDTVGVTDDGDSKAGKYDGGGLSLSAQALAAAGIAPGKTFEHGGLTYTWPDAQPGTPNVIDTRGQAVLVSGQDAELGFIGSGTSGALEGTGTILYTDGTTQPYGLSFADWWNVSYAPQGSDVAVKLPYINNSEGRTDQPVNLFATTVPLKAGKTVQAVILPRVEQDESHMVAMGHIFAMAIGGRADVPAPQPSGPQGQITGVGGMCVGLATGSAAGVPVRLRTCDATAAGQKWVAGTDGTLWNQGRCLTTANKGQDNGTETVVDICDGSAAQKWTTTADKLLVNTASGKCLLNSNDNTSDGNPLIIWTCGGGNSGLYWNLPAVTPTGPTGRISGYNGKCVEAASQVQLNTCGSQLWTAASDSTLRTAGKCLSANGTADGTKTQAVTCDGSSAQKWTVSTNGTVVSGLSGKCLDATGPSSANGTALQVWACAASDNQIWSVPSGKPTNTISGYGSKCAEVAGGTTANGTQIQLNTCGTGSAQQWTVAADSTLRALGKCLTANGTTDGTKALLSLCASSSAQKWTAKADGTLVNTLSGKCLDATGPSSANGTPLQVWACATSDNQKWKLPSA
ncbi:ricin-type beta-trefoil lectin domain protein [Actinoplanes sp. CA-131856]